MQKNQKLVFVSDFDIIVIAQLNCELWRQHQQTKKKKNKWKMTEKGTRIERLSNMNKPVPMKLFAAWEVDRTPPNCIPR